jgi:tRNA/tmRNA/rRNA uracil-C5-methylase (TrmA/RlmC/RlmD family)
VLGIEVVPEAIQMAKRHGEGCNAEFVCMEAETIMPDTFFEYDTLLLDPPRAGLHPKVMKTILASRFEDIIYVSCNPARGIADIAKMMEPYQVESIALFDQFPQTQHVEMIAHLRRREG